METVSFINGMLKYDPQQRYSIEKLYRHQFLNKNIKDFHKINLNKIKENVVFSKIKMNTKMNHTIWDFPEKITILIKKKLKEIKLKLQFMKSFEIINNDFICIEPKVIPIIPGDDPSALDIKSEFKYDNF